MFREEDTKLEAIKRNLIAISAVVSIVIHLVIATMNSAKYIGTDGVVEKPNISEFCSLFGKQLIKKKVHSSLVAPDVHKGISKNNYGVFEFTGKESIFYISEREKDRCEVVLKDDIGLRTFQLGLNEDTSNSLYYKIISIQEVLDNPRS